MTSKNIILKRNAQFALPLAIILANLLFLIYYNIRFFVESGALDELSFISQIPYFIIDSTLIFLLFASLNQGKAYFATPKAWFISAIFFFLQLKIPGIASEFIITNLIYPTVERISGYEHLSALIAVFGFICYYLIFIALFFILRIALAPEARTNTIEAEENTTKINACLYTALIASLYCCLISFLPYFEWYSISSYLQMPFLILTIINAFISFNVYIKIRNTPQSRLEIKPILLSGLLSSFMLLTLTVVVNLLISFIVFINIFNIYASLMIYAAMAIIINLFIFTYISYLTQKFAIGYIFGTAPTDE
ncbi:hypothetical protein [Budvicia diplopodorum]|uniref:hypothetical protein n=1 Tax=Budvicia diplopodorum TaxID=1119056 RepID=UPI0013594BE1|nr:hypothetical protein [Budvicia diplopodorum]